ncbi:MAG: hypothetical protein K1X79_06760 [Oligoflexia bacterium]|nr:hypothetical protein [Oligoflexia bacterium]
MPTQQIVHYSLVFPQISFHFAATKPRCGPANPNSASLQALRDGPAMHGRLASRAAIIQLMTDSGR